MSSLRLRRIAPFLLSLSLIACTKSPSETQAPAPRAIPEGVADAPIDPATAVAKIDGEAITEAELAKEMKGTLIRARNEYLEKVHQMRRMTLDQVITRKLLERKAKAENLTPEKLLERDVLAQIPTPSEEEMRMVYDQTQASGRMLPPYETVKPQIEGFLKQQRAEEALGEYHKKLRAGIKIEDLLPPLLLPKVDVSAVGPSRGDDTAPVTIVEFSDFECPYCSKAEPTLKRILDAYPGKVRIVYRDFPLDFHPTAQKASEAALCAGDQGKYWEMHEKLFANQEELQVERLKEYAKELALDGAKFDQCLDTGAKEKTIEESKKAGEEVGVGSTPMFFINGRPVSGALPFEDFKVLIDLELGEKS